MGTRRQRSRSPNRAGSVYPTKDGRWRAAVSLGRDESGKPVRKVAYGKTESEAREALIKLQGQYAAGALRPEVRGRVPTLGVFIAEWLDSREGQVNERTLARYRQLLNLHVVPTLGMVQLSKLTDAEITKLLASKVKAGMSPRTAYHVRSTLRTCLARAQKRHGIATNPAAEAETPKRQQREMAILNAEQARKLIESADASRDGNLYAFLLTSGVRLGEALGATWTAYDDRHGTIAITRQLKRRTDGTLALDDLKTHGSVRTLHLSQQARDALEAQRGQQADERAQAGVRWDDSGVGFGLIFRTPTGHPMDAPALTKRFHKFCDAIGIPSIRTHDLRHTFATMALANGVSVLEVSRSLGHSKTSITWDTYGHSSDSGQRAMATAMSTIFATR